MPIYEYVCPGCGYETEALSKMDAPDPPCPECEAKGGVKGEATTMEKKVSQGSFKLKGGSWAKSGYE